MKRSLLQDKLFGASGARVKYRKDSLRGRLTQRCLQTQVAAEDVVKHMREFTLDFRHFLVMIYGRAGGAEGLAEAGVSRALSSPSTVGDDVMQ